MLRMTALLPLVPLAAALLFLVAIVLDCMGVREHMAAVLTWGAHQLVDRVVSGAQRGTPN